MADLISRLRLESGEFDSKIKRAGQELMAYSEHCKETGSTMGEANKDAKDFAKALGSMQTTSSSARGKINELTEAFVNLKVMYKNMTDEEKNNTFGKNLAASLDQLKTRIDQAKAELNDVNKELGNTKQAEIDTKGGLEGLTNALGINVKTLVGWGSALAAGKMALDVAKDAFMSSETNVDEWGRTVRSAEGIYQSFVQSLNTGDFTGFLNNIGRVTQAAKDAYDALDELGTRMTIINPERARLQARQQELRADIRRSGADSEVGKAALAELKKIEPLLSKSFKTESQMNYTAFEKLVRERLAEGGINLNQRSFQQFMKTFSSDAAFQNLRRNARGSSELRETSEIGRFQTIDTRNIEQKLLDLFTDKWRQANSGYLTASFSAQGAAASNALGNARYMRAGSGGGKGGKTDIQFADDSIMAQEKLVSDLTQKWKTASGELRDGYLKDLEEAQQKLAEMTNKAKGPDFDKLFPDMSKANFNTGYAGSAQAKYDSARADLALGPMNLDAVNIYISSVKGMLKDANLGDELYNNMTKKLKDATTVSTLLQEMMERGLAGADIESTAQALKEKLLSPEGIDQTAIQSFLDTLNAQIEEAGGVGLKLNSKTGEVTDDNGKEKDERDGNRFMKKNDEGKYEAKMTDIMSGMAGGINNVVSGLNTLGVEIPAGLQSVLGGMQAITSILSGIAVTAMAIEAIAGADAIIPFANGGLIGRAAGGMMIPGNFMSGDRLRLPVDGGRGMIGVNSGELILNRAQQGVIASELEGGGMQNLHLDTVIGAEDIRVILNNRGRRTGRGEYVQSRKYNG